MKNTSLAALAAVLTASTINPQGVQPLDTTLLPKPAEQKRLQRQIDQQANRQKKAAQPVSPPLASVPAGRMLTGNSLNGYWLVKAPANDRALFIRAFWEGSGLVSRFQSSEFQPRNPAFSVEDMSAALDSFYSDVANLSIPVSVAMEIATMRVNGSNAATIEEATTLSRKSVADYVAGSAPMAQGR
jgi:hypothetical protein